MSKTILYNDQPMIADTIFISRRLDEASVLKAQLTASGMRVIDESLIKVSPIRFTHTPRADWIFFSSRNAIKFFFEQEPTIHPGTRFAVFGKGSAETLGKYGRNADFVGSGNDSTAIARKFVSLVDGEIVLFPQAIESLQTVQRWLPFNNIARNLFVYKTELRTDVSLPDVEILVFTSPSNVKAFFGFQTIKMFQKVIAIGTSTALALKSKGVRNIYLPREFHEESILQAILEIYAERNTQSRDR